jgi:hypothetical protein
VRLARPGARLDEGGAVEDDLLRDGIRHVCSTRASRYGS